MCLSRINRMDLTPTHQSLPLHAPLELINLVVIRQLVRRDSCRFIFAELYNFRQNGLERLVVVRLTGLSPRLVPLGAQPRLLTREVRGHSHLPVVGSPGVAHARSAHWIKRAQLGFRTADEIPEPLTRLLFMEYGRERRLLRGARAGALFLPGTCIARRTRAVARVSARVRVSSEGVHALTHNSQLEHA